MLNSRKVEYLLIGGYAVGHYGYPRTTMDMDIRVAISDENSKKIVTALLDFGFSVAELKAELFLKTNQIVRFGVPPMRLEMLTTISGVDFSDCYQKRSQAVIDGIDVSLIGLDELRINKRASGRPNDVDDLSHLQE